jgi:hypothetical protein
MIRLYSFPLQNSLQEQSKKGHEKAHKAQNIFLKNEVALFVPFVLFRG